MDNELTEKIDSAAREHGLLAEAVANIKELLSSSDNFVYHASVRELVEAAQWSELNDRFFTRLKFGTGGLRGRTIGGIVTAAERGTLQINDRPEFPCVGTNAMNYYNLSRATLGLIAYLKKFIASKGETSKPRLVFCHDTRHFSREFAEHCAKIGKETGCDVFLYDGPRATPQMSFAIRELNCHAGVMITASHNPSHDNGYKVNFADGAAIVTPHTDGIIAEVNSLPNENYQPLPTEEQGSITEIGPDIDAIYSQRVIDLALDSEMLKANADKVKIVFTSLHGVGGRLIPQLLRSFGFEVLTVAEQDQPDGRFPTVASPNPENGPALKLAVDLAEKEDAQVVMGTDPDGDRLGVAVRSSDGKLQLITGNQIGSLMAWYRIKTLFDQGILNDSNKERAILIKTFVTTELQTAIAEKFGIRFVNTLTGFKYIGQKLGKYEMAIPAEIHEGYRQKSENETRAIRLQHSKYFVFGGEESYGYLACDFLRDKDGNAAAIFFAEIAAYAASRNLSLLELLDEIYLEFGYFVEKNHSKNFEGAEGAAKISKLAQSYSENPPESIDGAKVVKVRNFGTENLVDEEGDPIAKEKMIFFDLEDGRTCAVRPSGTEPKIKYYLFIKVSPDQISRDTLEGVKQDAKTRLDQLWAWLESDIDSRLN